MASSNNNLISTGELPDRFRAVFPFTAFNAVQSRCFGTVYGGGKNLVLSAPTGSGKTAVFELAVCRLANTSAPGSFKAVYIAPTKSLCSERQRDWEAKFAPLGVSCAALTGDTEHNELRNVRQAGVIITTPEKWDSITRNWRKHEGHDGHEKLMQMIKLVLIDEVHFLSDERGATLEAIIVRMKFTGSAVRFIAASATIPNARDIAAWLGQSSENWDLPAEHHSFGAEFRPVPLTKHVISVSGVENEFGYDNTLTNRLPDVIRRYSGRRPTLVFCFTRNSARSTAKSLAQWWESSSSQNRFWGPSQTSIQTHDRELNATLASGVAFHHAGMSAADLAAVERCYLAGDISVICCTSTLAVGVNLPCHFVIIKGTVKYHSDSPTRVKEYKNIEITQMLGRAGRPQFDTAAIAVIMCRPERQAYYQSTENREEVLHSNLIDHLNAEISLRTIKTDEAARIWLSRTFLAVRLAANPGHYQLDIKDPAHGFKERIKQICNRAIDILQEHGLVKMVQSNINQKLEPTSFGDIMARSYVQFDTMKIFLDLPQKAKVAELLSALSRAAEFKDMRFRTGEKRVYEWLNKNQAIKYKMPNDLDLLAHKVSLLIESVLGAFDLGTVDYVQRRELESSQNLVFQNAPRLMRCIVECKISLGDSVCARNALMLERSLSARCWDDTPVQMMQLNQIGRAYARRLAAAGAQSIEELGSFDAQRIESVLSRNPPFGTGILQQVEAFPRPRVSLSMVGRPEIVPNKHLTVAIKADIGFLNENPATTFKTKPIFVCLLADTSEGQILHFERFSAKKIGDGEVVSFTANLTKPTQTIRAYVMCEGIAGTSQHATLKPDISPGRYPARSAFKQVFDRYLLKAEVGGVKRRKSSTPLVDFDSNDYEDAQVDDAALAQAAEAAVSAAEGPAKKRQKASDDDTGKKMKETHAFEVISSQEETDLTSLDKKMQLSFSSLSAIEVVLKGDEDEVWFLKELGRELFDYTG